MHPILRNKLWLASYVLLWECLAVILAALLRVPGTLAWNEALWISAPSCLVYSFVCMAPWYVTRFLVSQKAGVGRQILFQSADAVAACVVWVVMAEGIGWFLDLDRLLDPVIPFLVTVGFLLFAVSVAFHYALLAVERSQQTATQAREAELRALKAQIHPHFLFNSLNSIAALTSSDAVKAREMAIRLSDFLRHTLGMAERPSVPWHEELDLARTYLEVERVRFGSRLQVEIETGESCKECQTPPLVLQPLVENAIRHGIATLVDGGTVRVASELRDGQLEVSVENEFDPESPAPRRHGHGLRNVRDRLQTRFGGAAGFSASAAGNRFHARMSFPCQMEK